MANGIGYEGENFEHEVRRIARSLWPSAEFFGAAMVDGRETDGIFETEDCIHIVEATTSRRRDKAQHDILKISKLVQRHRRKSSDRAVKGWFITLNEPTADQRKVAEKYRQDINTLSFSQFQSRLINSRGYLSTRDAYSFGSVRDPATGKHSVNSADIKYVPIDLLDIKSKEAFPRSKLRSAVSEGKTVVLLGDYGAGKSMTLREMYYRFKEDHLRGMTHKFPVYLNLRDHYGQRDSAEVIIRHATSIGFDQPSHLVRAWRAGYVHLLIDGFDEISTIPIQGSWHNLRDNRYRAMEAVRRLVREHPKGSGLLIAGRAHFFDNSGERHESLGLSQESIELSLTEFTDDQIGTYLRRVGLVGSVPSWLPTRPLLVGYLAAKGFLNVFLDKESTDSPKSPEDGWDTLLDSIADREAEIEAGIDGSTVRKILERLATKARSSHMGLGSISQDSVIQAFESVCGYSPDERGLVLLQRLPGLGVDREEENSRTFIDESFADACRSGDLLTFIHDPFNFPLSVLEDIESSMGPLGIGVASRKVKAEGFGEGKINTALAEAYKCGANYMASDIARLMLENDCSIQKDIKLSGLFIADLEFGDSRSNLSKLRYADCFFSRVEIESDVDIARMPSFEECMIDEMEGPVSRLDLPAEKFDAKCEIGKFNKATDTISQMLALDLPLGIRVCLTILRKLYMQTGSGRRENALYRGLDSRARRLVPRVLQSLQSEGFVLPDKSRRNTIWRPCRSHKKRVGRILMAPSANEDAVIQRCRNISD